MKRRRLHSIAKSEAFAQPKTTTLKNYRDKGFRWVKVEGCEYRLEKKQIIDWLSHFGDVKSEISEDTHEGSDDSCDNLLPVGNGIYSVLLKLERDMEICLN
jgi:hypothetical protein